MNVLILGCGDLGVLVGDLLVKQGHQVLGIRRRPDPTVTSSFPIRSGSLAQVEGVPIDGDPDAVLVCANPGLRRGRDNGLAAAAPRIAAAFPSARLVYTGSTAVYADAAGATVDERGPVDRTDPASAGLLAIEDGILDHPDSLVLRVAALVGPGRSHARDRLSAGEIVVRGDPDRPFSYVHEADCAEICVRALLDERLGWGILNCAAPDDLTVRDYYALLARQVGVAMTIVGDGRPSPSRRIDGARLQGLLGEFAWKKP